MLSNFKVIIIRTGSARSITGLFSIYSPLVDDINNLHIRFFNKPQIGAVFSASRKMGQQLNAIGILTGSSF